MGRSVESGLSWSVKAGGAETRRHQFYQLRPSGRLPREGTSCGGERPAPPASGPLHMLSPPPGILWITCSPFSCLPLSTLPELSSKASSSRKPSQPPPSAGFLGRPLAPVAFCAAPSPGGLASHGVGSSWASSALWPLSGGTSGNLPSSGCQACVTCAHGGVSGVHGSLWSLACLGVAILHLLRPLVGPRGGTGPLCTTGWVSCLCRPRSYCLCAHRDRLLSPLVPASQRRVWQLLFISICHSYS